MSTRSERVTFPGALGVPLAGILDQPANTPIAYALFAHCFTCSKDLKSIHHISRALAESGIAVLRFDFTGLGQSEGDFSDTNFTTNIADILAAADYFRRQAGPPRVLIGHSLGGTAMLAAAARVPESVAVATLAAPSEPRHLAEILARRNPAVMTDGEGDVGIGSVNYRIRRQMIDDLRSHNVGEAIASLDRALLVLHSPADKTVGIGEARRIFEAAKHPKSFVCLDGADHLLTRERDVKFVAEILRAWILRYAG